MATTRREKLFSAAKGSSEHDVIPATVRFKLNKKKGRLEQLSAEEKMLCALRKVLVQMSNDNEHGCRYYIAGNKVQVINRPTTTQGRQGEGQSYKARGRCRIGVCHGAHATYQMIEFSISYRDVSDANGLPDVEFFDPTTIDEIPRDSPIDVSALS